MIEVIAQRPNIVDRVVSLVNRLKPGKQRSHEQLYADWQAVQSIQMANMARLKNPELTQEEKSRIQLQLESGAGVTVGLRRAMGIIPETTYENYLDEIRMEDK